MTDYQTPNDVKSLLTALFLQRAPQLDLSEAELDILVNSEAALGLLVELRTAVSEDEAPSHSEIEQLLADLRASTWLEAYVDAECSGQEAAVRFPQVAELLQRNSAFRAEYELLLTHTREAQQGLFGRRPAFRAFAQRMQTDISPSNAAPAVRWQQLNATAQRLAVTIPLQLGRLRTTFGKLTDELTPKFEPALSYRSQHLDEMDLEALDQVLEFPLVQQDLQIRLRTGPANQQRGLLVLETVQLSTATPISGVRITLRDSDGGLLEGLATDEQGRAIFRNMRPDGYQLDVEHKGHLWQFTIELTNDDSSSSATH